MIQVYGIPNCDTVKKARAWLTGQGLEHHFHDFKKHGVPTAELDEWLATLGWERVLNRQGSTWRKLNASAQARVTDTASARQLLLAHPSAIKRPVVRWADGSLSIGFDATAWAQRV